MRKIPSPDARIARPKIGPTGCLRALILLAAFVGLQRAIPCADAADPAVFEGLPLMQTFTPLDYHGQTQCWGAAQDKRGVIYIGNFGVVLEYDGSTWRKIPVGSTDWINQLAYDPSSDRVYVAGHDLMGYLQNAPDGERVFVSLIGKLPADAPSHESYRGIHPTADGVFFVGEHQVARWRNERFQTWALPTTKQLHSGWAGGHLYVQNREIGLLRLDGDAFVPATDDALFHRALVRSVVDGAGGEVIVATYHDGVFTLRDGAVQPWQNGLEAFLKDKGIYQFLPLRDGSTAIATDTAGLLVLDRQGRFRSHTDNAGGLHGNNLLSLFEDAEGGLWVGLQSGVTRVEIDSPFSLLSAGVAEDLSNVICGDKWFDTLVLGTLSGLYRVVPADAATATAAHLERLPGITDTFTSAAAVPNGLLLAGSNKIVLLDRDARLVPVLELDAAESHLYVSRLQPGRVYVGSSDGKVRALQLDAASGRWNDAGVVVDTGHTTIIFGMAETPGGDLWMGAEGYGLLRARPGSEEHAAPVTSLLDAPGPLHGEHTVWVAGDGGAVFFQTPHGLCRPDESGESVQPAAGFDPRLTDGSCQLNYVLGTDPSTLWVVATPTGASSEGLHGRALAGKGDRPPVFQSLPKKVEDVLGLLQSYVSVERPPAKPVNLLVTGSAGHGVIRIDVPRWEARAAAPPFETLLRRAVSVGQEGAADGRAAILQEALPASRNSVHFEYAANSHALGAAPVFQTRLAGLERSQWSDFSDRHSVDYFDLPAGAYTFEVRARRSDGQTGSVASLAFRILPPWQRTWWAFALYVLLAAAAVYALVRWQLWRLRARNARLEGLIKERTGKLLHARDAADAANRAKSAFLANMTHELRTPLNAILGYSQILLKDPELSARNRERIATVDRSGTHLLSMINEVLDLSKIEAGKLTLVPADFALDAVLDDLCAAFRPRFAEKNLAFEKMRAPGLPAVVHTDAGKLRQVLFNLLGNALKFTRQGTVRLEVARGVAADAVRFAVTDTGIGITSEELRDIFLAFHQAGGGEAASQGTGLGLSISQRLVELLGGHLQVESSPGKGSRFWFELPLPAAAAAADALHARTAARESRRIVGYRGARRRLLIVDDEPVNRQVLVEWLAPLGFETEEAVSGEECLERCAVRAPDAILLDLRMGPVGGLEVARTLRQQGGAGATVRIVAVSASVFIDDRQQAIDAGCDDFLPKPFKEDQLLEVLGRLLTLEWVQDEPEATSDATAAPMAADPERFAREMDEWLGLARNGDILGLQARFAALRDAGGIPALHLPLAHRLETLLANYEIDRAQELLVEWKHQENG